MAIKGFENIFVFLKLKQIFLKMHGHKSKFVEKFGTKEEGFEKGRRFWKFKKMGGDEGIILKHKVKVRERKI